MHFIICNESSWIKPLAGELQLPNKQIKKWENLPLVSIPNDVEISDYYLAFASQVMPFAEMIPVESITNQAAEILERCKHALANTHEITIQSFSLTEKIGVITNGRAEIMRDKIAALLKQNKFRVNKNLELQNTSLVQMMIMPDRQMAVSIINFDQLKFYQHLLSPFAGGFTKIPDNKEAPSRAFKKIVEAQQVLGRSIAKNELLVDLGASPGGWTYIARLHGAQVISVDRSPLREDLMSDTMVTFEQGDAFKFIRSEGCDWVVSDIISEPKRVLELLNNWVVSSLCENFIFTIKFKGDENYNVLAEIKELIRNVDYDCILKQLNSNKNEATLMGRMRNDH